MDPRLFNSLSQDLPAASLASAARPGACSMPGGSLFAGEGVELSPSSFTSSVASVLGGDGTHLSPSSFVQIEAKTEMGDPQAQDGRKRRGTA